LSGPEPEECDVSELTRRVQKKARRIAPKGRQLAHERPVFRPGRARISNQRDRCHLRFIIADARASRDNP
jgi:hypothetical protein